MLIVLDGPEKAGKSTLTAELVERVRLNGLETRVRKWGKLDDGKWAVDETYRFALEQDCSYPGLVVWDRSWASEAVYGRLLGRDRRLAADPWLGEWLYGRAAQVAGLKVILLGDRDTSQMVADHDAEDLPVDVNDEVDAFRAYGRRFGWTVCEDNRNRNAMHAILQGIGIRARNYDYDRGQPTFRVDPRVYCGFPGARVVFVGERASEHESIPGGWLPFSTRYTSKYGRLLGDAAMQVGWTNAYDDFRDGLRGASLIVACGRTAEEWVREAQREVGRLRSIRVESVYHPAALYRWGRLKSYIPQVESDIRELVRPFVPEGISFDPSEEIVHGS